MSGGRRDAAEESLYQLGIITDILALVAKANTGADVPICGAVIEWIVSRQREQQERIEALASTLWRAPA